MKKLSKILCAVLMLALICTSLAFLVSADNTPDTVEKTTEYVYINAATVSTIEGNALSPTGGGNFIQYQQRTDPNGDGKYNDGAAIDGKNQLDAWIVTPNGEDPYVTFWAGEFQNGGSQWNLQNTYSNNGPILTMDSYYVVDLDIATASELITSIAISLPNRNVTGEWASSGGFPFGTNVEIKNYVPDLGAEWTHFTVVCSMKTNKQHIFVNGEYLGTTDGLAYNASQVDPNQDLRANGLKIEVAYEDSVNNSKKIFKNESISFDNVARRDIVDAEGIAVLDAIFAAETPDITAWAGYPTNIRTGSLPAYVEIDGVQYNDLGAVAEILSGNTSTPKQVKLLNNFPVLWVSCDAVIDMNGYSCEIYSPEGSTETTDGNTVTVDAPYLATQTDTKNGDFNAWIDATRPAGTNLTWSSANNNLNSANGLHTYISETMNGDKFVIVKSLGGVDDKSNTYVGLQNPTDITYNGGAAQYMVYDLDAALLTNDAYAMMTIARKNGSGMWGAANPSFNRMLNNQIGKFYHLTIVVDIANNDIYTYANNTLTYFSETNGFTGDDNFVSFATGESGWNFNGLRIGSNATGGLAFDNIQYRHITGDAAVALKTALSDKDITDWSANVYNASYVLPKFGEVAFIGEDAYYTADELSAALVGNDPIAVTIARPSADPITVNCNAVIETNGFDVNLVLGEGVTKVVEGTKVITTAPYQLSASFEKHTPNAPDDKGEQGMNNTSATAIKGYYNASVEEGLTPGSFSMWKMNDFDIYTVNGAGDNDTFIAFNPNHNGPAAKDIQFTQQFNEVMMTNGTSIYVVDIDIASDTAFPESMYLSAVLRFADGKGGTPFSRSMHLNEITVADGNWHHITMVGDMQNNQLYIFDNGVLVGTWGGEGYQGAFNNADTYEGGTGSSTNLKFQAVKVSNGLNANNSAWNLSTNQSLYVDGVSARVYSNNVAAGDIMAAVATGDLTNWSRNVTGRAGTALPKIITIDGVGYSSVMTAEAALTGDGESTVILDRDIWGKITVNKTVTVQDNDHDFNTLTIDPKVAVIDGNVVAGHMIQQGNQYIKLNAENVADYTVPVYWYESADADDATEVIYFPVGTTVGYIGNKITVPQNLIINGVLYTGGWCDGSLADDVYVTEWPTITADDVAGGTELYYYILNEEVATDITIKGDMKYNLSLYADFDVNVFVKDANGEYTIDGVKYTKYTKGIAANNLASDLTFDIQFVVDGVTYTERVTVNVLDYAETVLNKADVSDLMKKVMISALDYANEAYAFVSGNTNAQIEAILNNPAYAEYVVEANTEYGPANEYDLSGLISAVQLKIDSNVAFVLKVANGFTGEITISYNDYKGQAWTNTYTVEEGQQYIVLDDLKVYNLDAIFTISGNGISGQYNLGQYIKALVENNIDADFAEALFTYAKVAQSYKAALAAAQ